MDELICDSKIGYIDLAVKLSEDFGFRDNIISKIKMNKKLKVNYFAHESSYVDDNCIIGNDTKIWHFSHIQSNVKIGKIYKLIAKITFYWNSFRIVMAIKF